MQANGVGLRYKACLHISILASVSTAGFPISANDLGVELLDEINFLEVAVVECVGDEEGIAECSVTLGGNDPYAAVICRGKTTQCL